MPDDLDQRGIDRQLRVLVLRALEIQRAFDLAAAERGAHPLAEQLLFRAQVIRQPELDIEIAVIDGTNLPGQRADVGLHRLSCEACHTV